jgi:hypothetical protein
MMKTETLKAWAAGAFDGEGSVLIEKRVGGFYQALVAVAGTEEKLADMFINNWGGSYHRNNPTDQLCVDGSAKKIDRTVWFSRKEGIVFLEDILPYLVLKDGQARILIRALTAQEDEIARNGLKRSSRVLEPFYIELTGKYPSTKGRRSAWATRTP